MAEKDVVEYVQRAAGSSTASIVAPKNTATLFVQYDVLFEEITGKL
jgi:hypothetical protein